MASYKIGSVSEYYPDAVKNLVDITMQVAIDHNLLEECDPPVLEQMLCDKALQKFLSGGDDMKWDEDEFLELVTLASVHSQINYLKTLGFIDSIEDENGEEVVWVTDKGNELVRTIKEEGK